MNQIRFIETIMYAIMESTTEELREFLMLYEKEDIEIDAIQDNAKKIWEDIAFWHNGFALTTGESIDKLYNGIIEGTTDTE